MKVNKESKLFKKIYGCIAAGYVGAALGEPARRCGGGVFDPFNGLCGPLEGAHYTVIEKTFGGKIDRLLPQVKGWSVGQKEIPKVGYEPVGWAELRWHNGPKWKFPIVNYPPGTSEDGGERKFLVIKAILDKQGRITKEDLRNAWLKYVRPDKFGFHLLPRDKETYERMKRYPASESGKYDRWPGNVDVLMMIHPIGIINACDPEQAALDALDVCQPIQSSLISYAPDAAAAIAAAIAEAFNPNATIDSIIEAAIKYIDENVKEVILEGLDIAKQYPDIFEVREPFWRKFGGRVPTDSLEVVSESFALFWIAKGDPVKCMIGGANFGRDADCLASIAGAIAGAFKGVDLIPEDWIRTCNEATLNSPHTIIDMSFEQQAEELYKVLLKIIDERKRQIRLVESLL